MEIIVATGNSHKLIELAELFPGHVLKTPADVGFPGFDVEEDGETFIANALKKAESLRSLVGRAVLADDSGLVVRALGGAPGVQSARYGSPDGKAKLEAEERNALLLRNVRGAADRSCAFVCCLVLALADDRFFVVQESLEGQLLEEPRGRGGFGYDPVVFVPELGKSVAELGAAEKNAISHRGRAARRMAAILADLGISP
jgi:XTP/dITP diphosphohydrolase